MPLRGRPGVAKYPPSWAASITPSPPPGSNLPGATRPRLIAASTGDRTSCYRVFPETASGAATAGPVLDQVLDQLRPGDTLVVWKLDRLGRSGTAESATLPDHC
jgi:Resolvase, N terminal domain